MKQIKTLLCTLILIMCTILLNAQNDTMYVKYIDRVENATPGPDTTILATIVKINELQNNVLCDNDTLIQVDIKYKVYIQDSSVTLCVTKGKFFETDTTIIKQYLGGNGMTLPSYFLSINVQYNSPHDGIIIENFVNSLEPLAYHGDSLNVYQPGVISENINTIVQYFSGSSVTYNDLNLIITNDINKSPDSLKVYSYDGNGNRVEIFNNTEDPTMSISETETQNLNLYPNPATEYITVSGLSKMNQKIDVLDMNGRIVKSVTNTSDIITVELSDLRPAMYIVRIGAQSYRIIKQ